ncbi:hypothetical protein HDU83_005202 [Entophlyctis luteolus]|nr:hypothetical protein HDU83_005202 [Entophlyctis luteolus]KAJ3377220.1 hypothetical protein HDU84_008883 [Entophlyctis sp. JEL0112]
MNSNAPEIINKAIHQRIESDAGDTEVVAPPSPVTECFEIAQSCEDSFRNFWKDLQSQVAQQASRIEECTTHISTAVDVAAVRAASLRADIAVLTRQNAEMERKRAAVLQACEALDARTRVAEATAERIRVLETISGCVAPESPLNQMLCGAGESGLCCLTPADALVDDTTIKEDTDGDVMDHNGDFARFLDLLTEASNTGKMPLEGISALPNPSASIALWIRDRLKYFSRRNEHDRLESFNDAELKSEVLEDESFFAKRARLAEASECSVASDGDSEKLVALKALAVLKALRVGVLKDELDRAEADRNERETKCRQVLSRCQLEMDDVAEIL